VNHSQSIDTLRKALQRLPGVGPKTAQRMAFHLLERDRDGAREIADALNETLSKVTRCKRCNTFSEQDLCDICASPRRDPETLCVLETPADLESVEQAGVYRGMYFVLMGHLSPLDGIGPEELALDRLMELIREDAVTEVILASNLTAEGEATAEYIHQMLADHPVKVSRIARGVPVGGELEYLDHGTLSQAFAERRVI
jgi:recombination protein RecR